MKHSTSHSFEINLGNTLMPTCNIAIFQSINTLAPGDVLKISACDKNLVTELIRFCKKNGNTLLDKSCTENHVTLFIQKN